MIGTSNYLMANFRLWQIFLKLHFLFYPLPHSHLHGCVIFDCYCFSYAFNAFECAIFIYLPISQLHASDSSSANPVLIKRSMNWCCNELVALSKGIKGGRLSPFFIVRDPKAVSGALRKNECPSCLLTSSFCEHARACVQVITRTEDA